jgi:hypothetical protein
MLTFTGTFYVNGFTIRGNLAPYHAAVHCPGRCTVLGPGRISEGYYGVQAEGDVDLVDVTLQASSFCNSPTTTSLAR